jgi:hypothetical protein
VDPIIFVLGPSGVGKSCVSAGLAEDYSFLHLDIDQNRGFEANGFPAGWDEDLSKVDFANLATAVRGRLAVEQRAAAVLSFPTVHVFSPEQLEAASRVGITTVVLWGTKERCIEARRVRARKNRMRFDLERYERKNRRTFETYGQSEYASFRVEAFQPDGSRWPREHILALIMERTAG